jgi:hypothetical protein
MGFVTVTGFGVPTGTITPDQVTVTLQPVPSGTPVLTTALSIVNVIGGTRRFNFVIPPAIVVTSPQKFLVSLSGTTTLGTTFASSTTAALTVNPPAAISLQPTSAIQGALVPVTITGIYSHFLQGGTAVTAGLGISVSNIVVASPTSLTAQFAISPAAVVGPATVTVTTGHETSAALFMILPIPTVLSVSPSKVKF